jgi:hypothetical protein
VRASLLAARSRVVTRRAAVSKPNPHGPGLARAARCELRVGCQISVPPGFLNPSGRPRHCLVVIVQATVPNMDAMLGFCDNKSSTKNINAISGILNAAYSMGGIIGPIMGSMLTSTLGFAWVRVRRAAAAAAAAAAAEVMLEVAAAQPPQPEGQQSASARQLVLVLCEVPRFVNGRLLLFTIPVVLCRAWIRRQATTFWGSLIVLQIGSMLVMLRRNKQQMVSHHNRHASWPTRPRWLAEMLANVPSCSLSFGHVLHSGRLAPHVVARHDNRCHTGPEGRGNDDSRRYKTGRSFLQGALGKGWLIVCLCWPFGAPASNAYMLFGGSSNAACEEKPSNERGILETDNGRWFVRPATCGAHTNPAAGRRRRRV